MISMAGMFLVQGKAVELPDSVGAQLGFPRAPAIATSTPFAQPSLNTLTFGRSTGTGTASACESLAARAQRYPGPDPLPAVRRSLVMKCEEEQRAGATAHGSPYTGGEQPTGYPEPSSGLDTKTKIAIGAGALLLAIVVAKKMKKR